jgi:hypothetical protein
MSDTSQAAAAQDPAAAQSTNESTQDAAKDSTTLLGEASDAEAAAEKADEGEKAEAKDAKPVEYGDFKLPEGIAVPEAQFEKFKETARANGLTQAAAQDLLDLHLAIVQQSVADHAETVSAWAEAVKADPEIGGGKYDDSLVAARAAISKFGDDELKAFFNQTGIGNHPALVRFAAKIGRAVREAGFTAARAAGQPVDEEKAALQKMYPKMYEASQ